MLPEFFGSSISTSKGLLIVNWYFLACVSLFCAKGKSQSLSKTSILTSSIFAVFILTFSVFTAFIFTLSIGISSFIVIATLLRTLCSSLETP